MDHVNAEHLHNYIQIKSCNSVSIHVVVKPPFLRTSEFHYVALDWRRWRKSSALHASICLENVFQRPDVQRNSSGILMNAPTLHFGHRPPHHGDLSVHLWEDNTEHVSHFHKSPSDQMTPPPQGWVPAALCEAKGHQLLSVSRMRAVKSAQLDFFDKKVIFPVDEKRPKAALRIWGCFTVYITAVKYE